MAPIPSGKRPAEIKFDNLVHDAYTVTLKPLGYKKKGNNFYLFNGQVRKLINLQKSLSNTKDQIRFTINLGIFSPGYWNEQLNRQDSQVPGFPSEVECVLRKRIGQLLDSQDTWYGITDSTEDLFTELKTAHAESPVARLIILHALKRTAEAKEEVERLLQKDPRANLKSIIIDKAKEFGLL